jgi:hypothetical protein
MPDVLRPPIPASLADRPVTGGISVPWINVELADGGADFRSTHRTKFEEAWSKCLCQSCGNPATPRAVLVCGPRQILSGDYDEPPVCPPCALYAGQACPMVAGRQTSYADRRRTVEGYRGARCTDPECGCGGWLDADPEHSRDDFGGQPAHPWYAAWITPSSYALTVHTAWVKCSDLGCEHQRTIINGGRLLRDPLKVILISEPGRGRIWRTLPLAEARAHAETWLAANGQVMPDVV